MNDKLLSLCKKFIENRDVFKSIYKMESAYLYPVCAAIFASGEKTVDAQTIRACGDLLKKKVSSFSSFRGTSRIVMISMLASDSDPEARLDGALNAYTSLKKHFFAGNYLPLAAMILSGELPENEFDGISERTREIYDLMRSEHPFLTSGEDCVFAMLLALSGQRPGDIVTEVERCYRIL